MRAVGSVTSSSAIFSISSSIVSFEVIPGVEAVPDPVVKQERHDADIETLTLALVNGTGSGMPTPNPLETS